MHFSQFWSLGNLRSGRQPVQCLARTYSWTTRGQFSLSLHYRLDGAEWGPGSSFIRALILRAPPMTYTHPNGLTLHHHIGESGSQLLKGQPKHSSSDFVGHSEEACLGQALSFASAQIRLLLFWSEIHPHRYSESLVLTLGDSPRSQA